MRIGIDAFSLDRPGGNFGVGRGVYAWNLLPHLFRLGAAHTFVVFANRENRPLVPRAGNVEIVVSRLPNRVRPLRILHEQVLMPLRFWKHRLDLVHFLGNDVALLLGRRAVLTVYDLMWKYYLDSGRREPKYIYFSLSVPSSLRRSGAVIAISRFIAGQVQEAFPSCRGKVFPVLLAAPPEARPAPESIARFEAQYPFPFLLSVTTSLPHKNLPLLLTAFQALKARGDFSGRLVVSGQLKGAFHLEVIALIRRLGLEADVRLTGFVSEEEKGFLYRSCRLFVFPSLYEGFGLPLLEAMQAGAPVVAARAASLPEVGGDACVYFDPFSAADLQGKMAELLGDGERARRLAARGMERAAQFSWATAARQTLDVYEQATPTRPEERHERE